MSLGLCRENGHHLCLGSIIIPAQRRVLNESPGACYSYRFQNYLSTDFFTLKTTRVKQNGMR